MKTMASTCARFDTAADVQQSAGSEIKRPWLKGTESCGPPPLPSPPLPLSTEAAAPHSPVLHAGVAPDGLLHVSMALGYLAGPGPLPGLDRTLRDVVAVTSLSAASASTTSSSCTPTTSSSSPDSAAASTGRWSGAEATKAVLAATLEVVLSAGERHLHPDPGV